MPREIHVIGNMLRVLNIEVESEHPLDEVLPLIEHRPPVILGLLPKTAVFVRWDESDPQRRTAQFMCELTPGLRTCRYGERRYTLSIPWTYFVYNFTMPRNPADPWTATDHRIFWAREPVRNQNSLLGRALVPNCNTGGGICYGSTAVDATLPIGARIDRLTSDFYMTTFAHDSGTGSPWGSETGTVTWNRWAVESRNDPEAWRRFPEWERDIHNDGGPAIGPMQTVEAVLGTTLDRSIPVLSNANIPPIPETLTFGRAREWLETITPHNRHRLLTELQAMAPEPGAITPEPPNTREAEDIGVLIPEHER